MINLSLRSIIGAAAITALTAIPIYAANHNSDSGHHEHAAGAATSVSGVIVIVSDIDATTKFLTDALGMSVVRNADTERYKETIVGFGHENGANLALIQMLEGESSVGPARIVFNTKDAPAASAAMKAAGYEVTIDRPTFVLGKDGDGNSFEFIQR